MQSFAVTWLKIKIFRHRRPGRPTVCSIVDARLNKPLNQEVGHRLPVMLPTVTNRSQRQKKEVMG
jgi:hypothetical protein